MIEKTAHMYMEDKLRCIQRSNQGICTNQCGKCDLLKEGTSLIEAYGVAILALEKQIPQKQRLTTIFEGERAEKLKEKGIENYQTYKCPVCNCIVAKKTFASKLHPDGWIKQNYCDTCGQKLDWEDNSV